MRMYAIGVHYPTAPGEETNGRSFNSLPVAPDGLFSGVTSNLFFDE